MLRFRRLQQMVPTLQKEELAKQLSEALATRLECVRAKSKQKGNLPQGRTRALVQTPLMHCASDYGELPVMVLRRQRMDPRTGLPPRNSQRVSVDRIQVCIHVRIRSITVLSMSRMGVHRVIRHAMPIAIVNYARTPLVGSVRAWT